MTTPQGVRPRSWAWPVFVLALVLGLLLLGGVVWANLEARLFYPTDLFTPGSARERLRGLRCPLVVAQDERAHLFLRVTNPLDMPVRRFIRITVALRHVLLVDQDKIWLDFAPHETRTISWEIPATEGVYGGRFLLTSVYMGATGRLVPALNDCGVWVWPLQGVSGAWAWALASGLVFGLLATGLYMGGLARSSALARGLFGLYLLAWLAEGALRAWVVTGGLLALIAATLVARGFQWLEGPTEAI